MAGPLLGEENAVHMLRRAGFGPKGGDWKKFAKNDRDWAAGKLIDIRPIRGKGPNSIGKYRKWWLRKMMSNRHRLREKMTLFWHDHFGVNVDALDNDRWMFTHIRTLRTFGFGRFRDLLLEVTRDNAMLAFLDGRLNRYPGAINENYGREIMELYTLGVKDLNLQPNYTQDDVVELSRALSGFFSTPDTGLFFSSRWDPGVKTLFAGTGHQASGNLGVLDNLQEPLPENRNVMDVLLTHRDSDGRPTAARFITKKLWEWFAYPDPPNALIDELADVFMGTTGDYVISDLVRAILTHDEFYSTQAKDALVKNPADFTLQALRAFRVRSKLDRLVDSKESERGELTDMGMNLLAPPSVNGWRHGEAWVGTGPWLARVNFAQELAAGRDPKLYRFRPERFVPKGASSGDEVVDAFLAQLHLQVDPEIRQALIDYLGNPNFSDPQVIDTKVRGLVVLLLTLPGYHVH